MKNYFQEATPVNIRKESKTVMNIVEIDIDISEENTKLPSMEEGKLHLLFDLLRIKSRIQSLVSWQLLNSQQ
jgi:hypothetical protein